MFTNYAVRIWLYSREFVAIRVIRGYFSCPLNLCRQTENCRLKTSCHSQSLCTNLPASGKTVVMTGEENRSTELLHYFTERRDEILDFIDWLVGQESMSREAEATSRIAENYGERLARIGATVDRFHDLKHGTTIRARFASSDHSEANQLLVVGHLDT